MLYIQVGLQSYPVFNVLKRMLLMRIYKVYPLKSRHATAFFNSPVWLHAKLDISQHSSAGYPFVPYRITSVLSPLTELYITKLVFGRAARDVGGPDKSTLNDRS